MKKKVVSLFLSIFIIFMCIPNVTYAVPMETNPIPLGPNVKDFKGSSEITNYFQDLKRIRANFINIDIKSNSTTEELNAISNSLDTYIEYFKQLISDLDSYALKYQDSALDVTLANQISFISNSYIMSLNEQKNLINALLTNETDSKNLFYSNRLVPVYYFLTLGDQMLTYIDTYYTF